MLTYLVLKIIILKGFCFSILFGHLSENLLYSKSIQFGIMCCILLLCLFNLLHLDWFLSFSLTFMTLTRLRIINQLFCDVFHCGFILIPFDLTRVTSLWQKYYRSHLCLIETYQEKLNLHWAYITPCWRVFSSHNSWDQIGFSTTVIFLIPL